MKKNWNKAWELVFKKGNIWALAVAVLVGAAFGAVINSLAKDIIMQAIAKAGGFDSVNTMSAGTTKYSEDGIPLDGILYGKFLAALISFFIIVFSLILMTFIGLIIWGHIKKKRDKNKVEAPVEPPKPTSEELILQELKNINESLKASKTTSTKNVATTKKK